MSVITLLFLFSSRVEMRASLALLRLYLRKAGIKKRKKNMNQKMRLRRLYMGLITLGSML